MASPQESIQRELEASRRQDPRDEFLEAGRRRRPKRQGRSVPTWDDTPAAPGVKPMSVGGFAGNVLENAWSIAKGFVDMFPIAIKSGAEVFGDPEGMALLAKNPEFLVQAFRQTGENLKNAVVEPYRKHGIRILYDEPLTPALDAMTVLSLGGAGMARAGSLLKNERLFRAGNMVKGIPERIGQELTKLPLKAAGINPETRQAFLRIRRHEHAGGKMEAGVWRKEILGGMEDLTEAELKAAEKLILDGGTKADLASNPRAAKLYGSLDRWLKTAREAELGEKGRALLNDKQMLNRVISEFAERNGLDFRTAAEKYAALEVKPLYAPAIRDVGGKGSLAEAVMDIRNAFMDPAMSKKGKVGFLERFESAMGTTKDIRKRISRAIDDFYMTRANLRLIDRIIQTPGLAKVAGAGEVPLRELLPSQGIHATYFKDKARAQSLFVTQLEATHGPEQAARLLRSDPATQKALNSAVNISIPDETLRKLIRREFTRYGGDMGAMLRLYDRVTNLFRTAATKLNPKWYTGNVMGDALLASLAGANWKQARRLIDDHIKAGRVRMLGAGGESLAGESGGTLRSLSDFVGAVDDAARAGIFTQKVADKVRSTMLRFGASEEALKLAVQEVALAPDMLADIMVRNQQLGEHVARNSKAIQGLDSQIAKVNKELNAALMEETRQRARMMAPSVRGRSYPAGAEPVGKVGISEYERLERALDSGKLTFEGRRRITDRMRELQQGAPVEIQRGADLTLPRRQTRPSAEIQQRLDELNELREAAKADLTKNMRTRDIQNIPELARKAEIAEEAMDRANTFLGEYLGLGPIERGVFRRAIPFYAWSKAMAKVAFTFPFLAPKKAFFWHRYAAAMTEMMGDPELPDWLSAYAPVFVRQNGDTVWARFTSLSPFGSLRTEKVGNVPVPGLLAFWRSNPWIATGYRLVGGKDVWNSEAVPYGEPLVAINDGEVYKFNEKGQLERELAQPPLLRTFLHMFPVVQMGDQLISNYDVRKGRAALNADGTVRYPIELHQRLADLAGVKLMHRNREGAISSEKLRVKRALEELKRKYATADPEERLFIEGVFRDYQRGEYRRIAAN